MTITASLLLQAAHAAASAQQYPKGALYLVATPIGNLADLSLRAVHVLSLVDSVACEDTRHSGALLRHLGLHKPLLALHEHNESAAAAKVCDLLAQGQRVAYVSDAGTPAVSDPGAALVATVRSAGYAAVPIPGASSALAAVSVAGDTVAQGFRFIGFLPSKGAQRRQVLDECLDKSEALVLFEAPHRIEALAKDLAQRSAASTAGGSRLLTVCRELTKTFEDIATLPAAGLPAWLAADPQRTRGEFVLVLHAVSPPAADALVSPGALRTLRLLLAELPLKQAASLAAQITGAPRNALYDAALTLRDANDLSSAAGAGCPPDI